uniref:CofH family radical SAM protein n=1 Tax=Desulfatirhabdium butyrativorans TaxID=340467 RepID=A0A7C4VRJ2_9BACT
MIPITDDIADPRLRAIADNVLHEKPISEDDALFLLGSNDILDIGRIAQILRHRWNGKKAYYGVNMNLNYTNVCELRCPLCAFSCDADSPKAYLYDITEVERRVRSALSEGIDEVHIVGGLRPDLPLTYFEEMLRTIKRIDPNLFIVAFTAVEYDYFARINGLPLKTVIRRLIDAGLGAIPGGGAEIFAPEVRRIISPKKISGERWLEVMRTAHGLGLKTNATMLFGHIETDAHIVDHLSRIRLLQSETGGFKTFVPLAFHPANTAVSGVKPRTSGYDIARIYATSRIFLHNIPHIKALWMYVGERMAQNLLWFGVDDIGATYNQEKVVHAAGASTPDFGSESFLKHLITAAGFEPVRTTAAYAGSPKGETPFESVTSTT